MNLLTHRTPLVLLWLGAIALAPLGALAHGDEDHGEKKAPAASSANAGPRFEAHSDLFEVVGTVERDQLTITVDRYASNEPVRRRGLLLSKWNTPLQSIPAWCASSIWHGVPKWAGTAWRRMNDARTLHRSSDGRRSRGCRSWASAICRRANCARIVRP